MKPFVILYFLVIMSVAIQAKTVQKNGILKVQGTFLVNEKGENVVLRGVSFGWHNWWPRFYTKETVKWLADDWNCTVVRAAMGVEPNGGYLSKPKFAHKKMEAVIDAAIENNIYVLIDWHAHGLVLEEAKEFFAKMAIKYGEYPNVIYEIYNEPVHHSWEEVKAYSLEVIDTIRMYDPDNIILVGSPHWDQDVHLVADDPIEGQKNIMYSLHYYAATHKQELRDRGDYALQKGIPLFVSECAGMEANGDGPINEEELQKWLSWSENHKISTVFWSIADKDESCSMLIKEASSKGEWPNVHLKEWGIKARDYIRATNE